MAVPVNPPKRLTGSNGRRRGLPQPACGVLSSRLLACGSSGFCEVAADILGSHEHVRRIKDVAGLTTDSRIKANQVRTVDKRRLVNFKGSLPSEYLPRVEKALKIHLNIK